MILKTITVLCFVFSILIFLSPVIILIEEGNTHINVFAVYFFKLFTQKYFITIPLFIGAFLFVYLFLMKKLKEPEK